MCGGRAKRNISAPVGYPVCGSRTARPRRRPMPHERKDPAALTAVGAWLTLAPSVMRRGPTGVALALVLALGTTGCTRDTSHRDRREDTLTSGHLVVAAEPDLVPLVAATARAFEASYPAASILVVPRVSRDAMGDVFGNRANVAVIGREIEQVERETATEARIEMDAYR